ncbi:PREDICTED: glycine-rich cell wall structural protein-like [Bactrocera latifrons]|nr:PREDICTED: glycine-rich cell wall structural protein-like [Bactrocera latifrons]
MRFCILFALIIAIYGDTDAHKASEQSAVAAAKALPTEELASAAVDVQPNRLLEDVDAGGEHAEEAERAARSFGWGGFGGYGYKRWGGYGGYGGHRGYGGYGGYGYRPHYAVVYRQPYYHGYGHKYWG